MNQTKLLKTVLLLLAGLYVLRLAAGAFLPVFDPSEGRYASIIRHMAESGDFLTPRLWHEGIYQSFDGKTPLFFQCGALAAKLFGIHSFAVRLPSVLAGIGMLCVLYGVMKRFRNETECALALLFCGTAAVFYVFSGVVLTDMLLAFTVSGAVLCFSAFLAEPSAKRRTLYGYAVFAFLGLGFITKGPVAVALFGIGPFFYLLFNREWKKLRALPWFGGFALFLLIAAPWFILKWLDDPDAVIYFFYNENFKRFVSKEYGDRYGAGREMHFGASLWMLLLVTMPWCLLWFKGLFRKEDRAVLFTKESLRDPVEGVALFSFAGMTLFWALTSRVLLYYMLPVIPMASLYLGIRASKLYGGTKTWMAVTGACLSLAVLTGLFVVNEAAGRRNADTTYYVLAEAERVCAERGIPEDVPFCFLRQSPYSADFYRGTRAIRHHAKENAEETFEKNPDAVLLAPARYLKRLKDHRNYEIIGKSGEWRILVTTPAGTEREDGTESH